MNDTKKYVVTYYQKVEDTYHLCVWVTEEKFCLLDFLDAMFHYPDQSLVSVDVH